jgi:hypothetical protein
MAIQVISAPAATTPQAVREFVIPGSSCLRDERAGGFSTGAAIVANPSASLRERARGVARGFDPAFRLPGRAGGAVIGYLAPPLFDQEASE